MPALPPIPPRRHPSIRKPLPKVEDIEIQPVEITPNHTLIDPSCEVLRGRLLCSDFQGLRYVLLDKKRRATPIAVIRNVYPDGFWYFWKPPTWEAFAGGFSFKHRNLRVLVESVDDFISKDNYNYSRPLYFDQKHEVNETNVNKTK